jgi:hypothetical protein
MPTRPHGGDDGASAAGEVVTSLYDEPSEHVPKPAWLYVAVGNASPVWLPGPER